MKFSFLIQTLQKQSSGHRFFINNSLCTFLLSVNLFALIFTAHQQHFLGPKDLIKSFMKTAALLLQRSVLQYYVKDMYLLIFISMHIFGIQFLVAAAVAVTALFSGGAAVWQQNEADSPGQRLARKAYTGGLFLISIANQTIANKVCFLIQ